MPPMSPVPTYRVGVFGGSFNPIHLGHALLAITVQQTKPVDEVVLVPVYKHAVKRDLLPFDDRVEMCQLAVSSFGISVSRVEEEVGESNGAMLKGLKKKYPEGTQFLWICGDDFFGWMHKPKGIETLAEVSGLIVQRRLHRNQDHERMFYKEPIDEQKIRNIASEMNLTIDFVYGELPHFSSTLVRRAPGNWRSFLTQAVAEYLDQRRHLLTKLIANLEADALREQTAAQRQHQHQRTPSILTSTTKASRIVLVGLDVIHALQLERGHSGLMLSTKNGDRLSQVQEATDSLLASVLEMDDKEDLEDFDEVVFLLTELNRVPVWLQYDRAIILKKRAASNRLDWMGRLSLVEKFNSRIDVLIGAIIRALMEIMNSSRKEVDLEVPGLLLKWCEGKEALGRLRAFVSAVGPDIQKLVQDSFKVRERLCQRIDNKDRLLDRVLSSKQQSLMLSTPDALHKLLERVTVFEYTMLGSFASSTPLPLVHKILRQTGSDRSLDLDEFVKATSAALDFLLTFAKALAASAIASV